MKLKCWGKTHDVIAYRSTYQTNGTLAVILVETSGEPYGSVTVNLGWELNDNMAFLDVNNIPNIMTFVEHNKLGTFTGIVGKSGFCNYPLYKFDLSKLEVLDENTF